MAIYPVQNMQSLNAAGNPNSIVLPNLPNPGNLLVGVSNETTTTSGAVSIPNFTLVNSYMVSNTATSFGFLLTCQSAAGQSQTITITDSGTPAISQFQVSEFQGATTTLDTAVVTLNSGATTANTYPSPISVTTTSANTVLISVIYFNGATTQASTLPDSGFILMGQNNRMASAYKIVSTAGTYTMNWAWATASKYTGIIAAFQMRATPPNPTAFFNI